MQTDNDRSTLGIDGMTDSEENTQEKSLQWLLEMDFAEPEEKLFSISDNAYCDEGLSAYEAEVASRPLVRGNAASDDLDSYIEEEIVISSDSERSDIYGSNDQDEREDPDATDAHEVMAVDYSHRKNATGPVTAPSFDDGSDILGLASEDDIGEKFLSVKRVKPVSVSETQKMDNRPAAAVEEPRDAPGSITLTEAPVPSQVIEPGAHAVANEEPVLAPDETIDTADTGNVLDYVATMPQPVDDDEFDKYLLGGEHLADNGSDPEELTVQRTEGVVSVDPSPETLIDYHEDFHAMEGFVQDSVSAITAVISPVMEEISHRVGVRAQELGCAADAIEVDVMLGSDEESIKRCYSEGFEPVSALCAELPQALQGLDRAERDTLYVRLFNGQANENWNDLFSPDFQSVGEEGGETESGVAPTAEAAENDSASWLSTPDLAEDFLSSELTQDVESGVPASDAVDIDAMFDDLLCEDTGDDAGDDPVAVADDSIAAHSPESNGFGEDIFGEDFAEDFVAKLPDETSPVAIDIEAAFSSLAQPNNSIDEICGVDVDEFVDDEQRNEQVVVEGASDSAPDAEHALPDTSGTTWCIPENITFSYTTQSGAEIFDDFLDAFIEEGSAEVEKLEDAVGEWEKDVAAEAVFAVVSRILHTIKGIAKGVGLQRYGTLIHNFETLLEAMPRPTDGAEAAYFRIVNAWLDAVVRGIEFVTESRADIDSELPVIGGKSTAGQESAAATDNAEPGDVAEDVTPIEPVVTAREKKRDQQLADEGAKVLAAQQSVRITSDKLDHLLNLASQSQQLGVRASQNISRSKRSSAELQGRLTSVRTHIGKIADRALLDVNARGGQSVSDMDALEMDQYSELQEAASILREGVEDLADLVDVASRQNALVEALLQQQSLVISSISSAIQAARVVPVSRLMPGLRRIVRTVSTDLGKTVSFKVLNETGALDRDHYSRCQVILEHMVRNALDHGIESSQERLAAGKPTGGRITIDVRKSGADYIIKLADDGKGIDPDIIRESAYEKGLDIDVDALSDEEVIRLIFHKGFSTTSSVSEISGRGVGMDIVMSELQQIGGDIQIHSAVGLGTSFEVRIPSNVTVNGALLVAAAENSYAIPLNGLIAVEQVPTGDFFAAVEARGNLSLFDMDCEPAYLGTLCQGVSLPDRCVWGDTVPVIIAGSEERYMAIAIDNVEEALELVVRSLGAQFSSVPGVAGAATTADGEAVVALDLNLLVASVASGDITPVAVSEEKDTTLLALVVDDSRTQRMVATSQLDTVGVETVTAENGQVAIDLLNATHRLPDVILLDVEMPVKDGIQTLREIRQSQRYGHIPVIMVTSRTGAKHRALAKNAGCNAYMGKPFNFPALIEQISDLTGYDLQLS